MFGYAPSNGISHGTKQSISMILAPKRWLKFVQQSVIVANWAKTSPHFLLHVFLSLGGQVAFHSGHKQRAFRLLNTGIAWIVVKARFYSSDHFSLCYSVFDGIHLLCLGICFAARSLCQLLSRRLLLALGCWFLERMKAWQCLSCLKCVSGDSLTKQICAIAPQSNKSSSLTEREEL